MDYVCIIDVVKLLEVMVGNIVFIVELLRNIFIDLFDNVIWEKMKVFFVNFIKKLIMLFLKYCILRILNVFFRVIIMVIIVILVIIIGILF